MYFAVLTLHRLSWPCHVWVTIRVSLCNAVRFLCSYHSNVSQLVGPPAGGALFKRFGIRSPCIFGVVVISVDLIGRLLLIERREALALGFDPAASISASSGHASDSASHAVPHYGTFAVEAGLTGETSPTDNLLDRESRALGAMKIHPRDDPIPFLQVIRGFFTSSRAVAAGMNSLVCGYVA